MWYLFNSVLASWLSLRSPFGHLCSNKQIKQTRILDVLHCPLVLVMVSKTTTQKLFRSYQMRVSCFIYLYRLPCNHNEQNNIFIRAKLTIVYAVHNIQKRSLWEFNNLCKEFEIDKLSQSSSDWLKRERLFWCDWFVRSFLQPRCLYVSYFNPPFTFCIVKIFVNQHRENNKNVTTHKTLGTLHKAHNPKYKNNWKQ